MDESEFTAAVKAAKADFETKAQGFRAQIDRSKKLIEKAELKLAGLAEECNRKVQEITNTFINLPQGTALLPGGTGERKRMRRGSLDGRVFEMLRSLAGKNFTIPDACDAWEVQHPGDPVTRSTMRGVVERLVRSGRLSVASSGGPGRANPKAYRFVAELQEPIPEVHEMAH